jgi:hypothetical protein
MGVEIRVKGKKKEKKLVTSFAEMLTLVPRSRWNCWACRRCDLGWDAGPVGAPLEAAAADGGLLPAQAAAAAQEAPFRSDPAAQEAPGHSDPSLVASESEHRRCCAAAWRHHWREGADLCGARRGEAAALSRLSCVDVASEASGSWYCSARQLLLNASAVHLGSPDVSVPTPAQKGLWGRRALLLDCRLDMEELRRPKRFRMLLGQLLPSALGEIDGVARGPIAEPAERTVVFVARYSVASRRRSAAALRTSPLDLMPPPASTRKISTSGTTICCRRLQSCSTPSAPTSTLAHKSCWSRRTKQTTAGGGRSGCCGRLWPRLRRSRTSNGSSRRGRDPST